MSMKREIFLQVFIYTKSLHFITLQTRLLPTNVFVNSNLPECQNMGALLGISFKTVDAGLAACILL